MDWFKDIFQRFDLIFWIIIGVGTAVASALKKKKTDEHARAAQRKQIAERSDRESAARAAAARRAASGGTTATVSEPAKSRNPLEQAMAEFERLFGKEPEAEEEEVEVEVAPAQPSAPARALVTGKPTPESQPYETTLADPLAAFEGFEGTDLQAWKGSDLLTESRRGFRPIEQQTEVVEGRGAVLARRAWKPTGSWRDAVILKEILGPPRAFGSGELPGFGKWGE